MIRARLRLLCLLLMLAPVPSLAAPEGGSRTGTNLSKLLRELSDARLQFVFSSRLVPDSLNVEVTAAQLRANPDVLQAVTEVLAPLGLGVARVAPGIYAVLSRPVATPPAPSVPSEPQAEESLREVVVAASRYRVADPTVSVQRLDAGQLALEITPGNDPLRAIARLPGIVQDGISARSHVRGGEEGEELLLLDGFPLRAPYHLAGYQSLFSVVDSGLIRSMDVYTGGFPARYGNRMSAVFDLHTFGADELPAHSLAADFINASARFAGRPFGFETVADARIGTLSPLLEAFAPRAGQPSYGDAFVSSAYRFDDGVRLSANVLWSRDELTISDERRGEAAHMDGRLHYAWLHAEAPLWTGATGEAWLGQSEIASERNGELATPGIASGHVDDRRESSLWDLRTRIGWEASSRHYLEGGADFTFEHGHYDYDASARYAPDVAALLGRPLAFVRDETLDPKRRRTSLWASHRWQIGPALTVDYGVRAEGVFTEGLETHWALDPRFGVRWDLAHGTSLHFNWGRFLQADEIHELKIEDGLTNFPAPQRSEHFIVSLDRVIDDTALRAAAFVKHQSDPRARFENVFNRRTILPEIGPDRIEVLPIGSEVHGFELSAERRWGPWQLAASTGWSEAVDEGPDVGYGPHTRRSWDVGWESGLSASWRAGPWTLTSALNRREGFPTTALVRVGPGYVLGERNGSRLPAALEWDARAEYVKALPASVLQLSMQVTNLLDAPNDCCTELLREGDSLTLRRLRGLPLLPSLGIRWSW